MYKKLLGAFAVAAMGCYAGISAQYEISRDIRDDFVSELGDVSENVMRLSSHTHAGLFTALVKRDYTTAEGICYEQYKKQTHILGVSIYSESYDRRCEMD
ncbi:MAG: hypothetical protein CMH27_10425 [Micavibrio sp.]|nr:hypothetical protein [Micavibrio sp.]|tara:strand:- start:4176 stop:4475 length:300 start_codon:yes stop_codon:yes gene_type:complete